MNKGISLLVVLASLLVAQSAMAVVATCPAQGLVLGRTNPTTGHHFEVYRANGIPWASANTDALARNYSGTPGHLATITSSSEETFVDQLRQDALTAAPCPLGQGQVWLGGYQDTAAADYSEPFGGWRWVNLEGPFPGKNTGPGYTDWATARGEPNNSGGNEGHLALGRYGFGQGWNDEGAAVSTLIGGYIVEYDVPRPAACDPSTGNCQTIEGQTLIFPPGSFGAGTKIAFNAFEFTDPRVVAGTCGVAGLTLFGPAYGKPELRIPPYLCGSPKFIVVAVDGSQLNVTSGTVSVENFTDQVPALVGNQNKICNDPIPAGLDPQFQDIVAYQTTIPQRMREDSAENRSQDPQFAGAAGEFTNSCGSSRAGTKEPSYFLVGMHIDFGPGNGFASNAAGNHDRFVALTRYKLTLLQQSVDGAKTAGALKNGDATKMSAQLDNAVKKLDRGDPSGALGHVNQFLKFVDAARYTVVPDNNYNGEHLMRGRNVEFMLRVKVVPYAR